MRLDGALLPVDLVLERAALARNPAPVALGIHPCVDALGGSSRSLPVEIEVLGVMRKPDVRPQALEHVQRVAIGSAGSSR